MFQYVMFLPMLPWYTTYPILLQPVFLGLEAIVVVYKYWVFLRRLFYISTQLRSEYIHAF